MLGETDVTKLIKIIFSYLETESLELILLDQLVQINGEKLEGYALQNKAYFIVKYDKNE